MNWFNFKNASSQDFDLIITEKSVYKGAARDVSFRSIPGRSGDLVIDNKRYKNAVIKYDVTVLSDNVYNLAEETRGINSWLLTEAGYFRLYDSYDSGYFRLASFAGEINIEQDMPLLGKSSIAFNCKPHKYSFAGQEPITLTEPGTINNPESFPSLPYIKITGSGNITIFINNDSFVFTGAEDYMEIDSETMNAYKGTVPQNSKMLTPKFPVLASGDNNISWAGAVTGIEIIPRWCCL